MRISFARSMILSLLLGWVVGCSKNEPVINEPIIARVGNREITVKEYIHRSEYSIRPPWCRGDDFVHRKVVLNSLIAEKLMALNGEKPQNEWINNKPMQSYLQGRKEQEMRQLHYSKTALEKVELTPEEERLALKTSERTYRVQIIPINDNKLADRIAADLQKGKTDFSALIDEFQAATNQIIEEKEYRFDMPLDDILFKQLYLNDLQKGQVVGPVHVEGSENFLLRVNGWMRRPVISDIEFKQRNHDIREIITQVRARDIYENFIKNLMSGKRLEFNEPIFRKVTEAVGKDYFRSPEERKKFFKMKLWNEQDGEPGMVIDDIRTQLDEIADEILFEFDGQKWTVEQFEDYLQIHPLVFRNRKMPKGEFALEFRNAVADILRDKEITQDAYAKNMDRDSRVKNRVTMWRDNLIALYERNRLLGEANADSLDELQKVSQFIDPKLAELRHEYDNIVVIDTDAFEKIKLTSVDMFVIQENVPFPVIVPQFPVLTTHDKLDHGRKMGKE